MTETHQLSDRELVDQLSSALLDLVHETSDMLTWNGEPDILKNARLALRAAGIDISHPFASD